MMQLLFDPAKAAGFARFVFVMITNYQGNK